MDPKREHYPDPHHHPEGRCHPNFVPAGGVCLFTHSGDMKSFNEVERQDGTAGAAFQIGASWHPIFRFCSHSDLDKKERNGTPGPFHKRLLSKCAEL